MLTVVAPWEWLRKDELLLVLQATHTPYRALQESDQDRLDTNLRDIEEVLANDAELREYSDECYRPTSTGSES